MSANRAIVGIEDYEPLVGSELAQRVKEKADALRGMSVAHVSSTYYGGGVATLLAPLTLLANRAGIPTEWWVIQGTPDFFSVTKKMHNALQGGEINLSELKKDIYEDVVYENSLRNDLHHDRVVVHDPQPLPMIQHFPKKGPWIWRCHIDLTEPNKELWRYLSEFVEQYDAAIFTLQEYAQPIRIPQVFFMPAIDPFSIKNRELSEDEIDERLAHYEIPTDLPLVTQISRFDRWKDPEGVIAAFEQATKQIDARLVLLGNVATDDPEGEDVYQSLLSYDNDRVIVLSREDTALVNALQSRSAVVLQKSIREGFGLTVTEAMWKGAAVIGANVGGIRYQIADGVNGFLVSSIDEAAERIVTLVGDEGLRRDLGEKARETVRERFLLIHLLEQYLDLFRSFETTYTLNSFRFWHGRTGEGEDA
jgi:trehalose synthase